ncbi:tyrosine-type recombinase/integrase [Cytobacillus gottheilii]|uniref:Tyrosine-type recombinase/integrase n=1 Tax=Cytobacillus gottheilii TaxID=859144 RepID=A0ABX8FIW7_9BACI|nr:tyrosine-type recombinase/integrase [Cytobacillus gottheilii]QVY63961.1 tyrosine-type recombinase/integrase [Cytobacillus gottheilii]
MNSIETQIGKYMEWLRKNGKTENTANSYIKVINYFSTWFLQLYKEEIEIQKVRSIDLEEWKKYLLKEKKKKNGEPLSIKTINNYIEGIKSFFRFLQESNIILDNPAEAIKPQLLKTEYTPRWLENKEKRILLRVIDDPVLKTKNYSRYLRNKLIIYLGLHAGLRISEIVNLSIYDFKDGYIQVREGKGQAARDIPMNKNLSNVLSEWMKVRKDIKFQTDALLVSQKGSRLTTSGIYYLFEKLVEKTNIKDLTPHTLRHTFANDLLQNNQPITYVAALLGHNDLDTTRIYTSPKKKGLQDAVDSLSTE